jgi:hypothetical protein
MGVETSWSSLLPGLHKVLRSYVPGIGKRYDDSIAEDLLSPEAFQAELTILGLSGRTFGPEEYAASLSEHLSLEIDVCVIPDADYPGLKRKWALLGPLAELRYVEDTGHVAVLVPGDVGSASLTRRGVPRPEVLSVSRVRSPLLLPCGDASTTKRVLAASSLQRPPPDDR